MMRAPKKTSAIRVDGDAAYVELTRGFEATIDACDVPLVEGLRWTTYITRSGHIYAVTQQTRPAILMHRRILGLSSDQLGDHKDGDGLNNRRSNIRAATTAQNNYNKAMERRNKLGLKGVVPAKAGRFMATIKPNGKSIHLGTYNTPEEAAAAYRGAARVLWGDFAKD